MVKYIVKHEGKKYKVMKVKREFVTDAFPVCIMENKERAELICQNMNNELNKEP